MKTLPPLNIGKEEKEELVRQLMSGEVDKTSQATKEYCPCGSTVTGDYGICSSPQCK